MTDALLFRIRGSVPQPARHHEKESPDLVARDSEVRLPDGRDQDFPRPNKISYISLLRIP
jgi:hypothetical protein